MWDFGQQETRDLIRIEELYDELEKLGMQQDEDMMRELAGEIEEREKIENRKSRQLVFRKYSCKVN